MRSDPEASASDGCAPGRKDAMKTYTGTMQPNRRDLADPRSSGRPLPHTRTPVLNDRRSTR